MKHKSVVSWILSIILSFCACNDKPANEKTSEEKQYYIQPINETDLKKLIKERNGKFLFLNIWATWCIPCKEEFPDLVRLQNDYQNSNVEIIGISVDYPDEVNSKILPFLKANHVNFKVFVQEFGKQEDFINTLNKEWNGGLPATFVFDVNGIQKVFIFGKHDYVYYKQQIEKLRNSL